MWVRRIFEEDWFKAGLLLLGFLFALIATYNQYLETKKHNLDAVNAVRLCADLRGSAATKSCADAARSQRIPGW